MTTKMHSDPKFDFAKLTHRIPLLLSNRCGAPGDKGGRRQERKTCATWVNLGHCVSFSLYSNQSSCTKTCLLFESSKCLSEVQNAETVRNSLAGGDMTQPSGAWYAVYCAAVPCQAVGDDRRHVCPASSEQGSVSFDTSRSSSACRLLWVKIQRIHTELLPHFSAVAAAALKELLHHLCVLQAMALASPESSAPTALRPTMLGMEPA